MSAWYAAEDRGMPAPACRHYLIVTVDLERRDRLAICQGIADALQTACTGVPEVEWFAVERNRVAGPGQADVILFTAHRSAADLVHVRSTVLRECIEKLRQEYSDFELRELSAMS
jgi:hypothetical protein